MQIEELGPEVLIKINLMSLTLSKTSRLQKTHIVEYDLYELIKHAKQDYILFRDIFFRTEYIVHKDMHREKENRPQKKSERKKSSEQLDTKQLIKKLKLPPRSATSFQAPD